MHDSERPSQVLVKPVDVNHENFFLPDYLEAESDPNPLYQGIAAPGNKWIDLACDIAFSSVKNGGGPFGAVIIQIDSLTGKVLRYWAASNNVSNHSDPTAHAEILAIRSACHSLGVFHLDLIEKSETPLYQSGPLSHCILFSSCEPCPMCYGAVRWARIPALFFAATRFDAASGHINFSDAAIYEEIQKPYRLQTLKVFKILSNKSKEAFELWKEQPGIFY